MDFCALKSDSAGIQPITAQGHQDKVVLLPLVALVHARGFSRMRREVTAEITATQSDLAGYVSRNWKTLSRFHSQTMEAKGIGRR